MKIKVFAFSCRNIANKYSYQPESTGDEIHIVFVEVPEKNTEQKSLKERIPQTAERIEELQASISNVTRFIDKTKRYTEINELAEQRQRQTAKSAVCLTKCPRFTSCPYGN